MSTVINRKKNLNVLNSPLWRYLSLAAETKFTNKEKQSIMIAQLEWEKENLESSKNKK